ncbi:MAG: hypothetical protein NZ930_04755 [Candidatus Bipolaricaulota bacterium]|nr:hypothetical protein [Candidatus Bipolaricaulota bacterium]MDW8030620.1 hypothetical protein [Candidatus Bipolaricaulota bacterium]
MGTLYALSMFALGGGWHMHGFLVGGFDPVPRQWAAGLAFLPARDKSGKLVIPGFEKNVVLLLRGDHCKDCGNKVNTIIDWVSRALDVVKSKWFSRDPLWPKMYPEGRNETIIALVFTNENATGIPTVIGALRKEFSESEIAIIVINFEKQSNGTVTVRLTCIGKPCGDLERSGVLERIRRDYSRALRAAMAAYPGYSPQVAWWLDYGVCGGDPDCIRFIMEQLEKELGIGDGGERPVEAGALSPQLRLKALMPC